jgi:hypothetical protein
MNKKEIQLKIDTLKLEVSSPSMPLKEQKEKRALLKELMKLLRWSK